MQLYKKNGSFDYKKIRQQMVEEHKTQFSNLQLTLLELYDKEVSDEDLKNIHHLIGQYFAERLSDMATKIWEEKGWTSETMEEWLNDPKQ